MRSPLSVLQVQKVHFLGGGTFHQSVRQQLPQREVHQRINVLAHGLDAVVCALLADDDVDLPLMRVRCQLGIILGTQLHVRDQQVVDNLHGSKKCNTRHGSERLFNESVQSLRRMEEHNSPPGRA